MPKTETNIKANEDFIKSVLQKNFGQSVDSSVLRQAAIKLCEAFPKVDEKAA